MKKVLGSIMLAGLLFTSIGVSEEVSAQVNNVSESIRNGDLKKVDIELVVEDNKLSDFSNDNLGELYSYKGVTYIPLRFLGEHLGYNVDWSNGRNVLLTKEGDHMLIFGNGSSSFTTMRFDELGEPHFHYDELGQPYLESTKLTAIINCSIRGNQERAVRSKIIDSRFYIPLRAVAENIGLDIEYREPNTSAVLKPTIYIDSENVPATSAAEATISDYSILDYATLIQKNDYETAYSYHLTFSNGATVSHAFLTENTVGLSGLDSNGNPYYIRYTLGSGISYLMRSEIPPGITEATSVLRDFMDAHWNPDIRNSSMYRRY